jgi:3',5'-cyclic AMP phosphodiesterase CpdA
MSITDSSVRLLFDLLMKQIAHISDLHFGTEQTDVVEALRADIYRLSPDLIVVSGDLTQRARNHQFDAAKGFLDQFAAPTIIVPGNHDIPLYNLVARLWTPFQRFSKWITDDLYPCYVDDELGVIGVNSVQHTHWKAGRLSQETLARLTELFNQLDDALLKVLVLHHNVVFSPITKREKRSVRRLKTLHRLIRCGVDLICLGHDHRSFITGLPVSDDREFRSLLAQAGTAVSRRTRGEANSYNVISKEGSQVTIDVKSFELGKFVLTRRYGFEEPERRRWEHVFTSY